MTKKEWNRGAQAIAVAVLIVSAFPFYHAFTVTSPSISQTVHIFMPWGQSTLSTSPYTSTYPAISVNVSVTFIAQGAFSANNPITVHVTVVDSNLTDFYQYYRGFGLTGSIAADGSQPGQAYLIPLTHLSNGTVEGTGKMKWENSGPAWPYLFPNFNGTFNFPLTSYEKGQPALTISDVSDTLAVNNDQTTLFLTWVLVGFSVLMLQPILSAVLLKEKTN